MRVHFFVTEQVCARIYGQMAVVVGLATWRITYNKRISTIAGACTSTLP